MESHPSIPSRTEAITAYKKKGGAIAAVFPIHYPRALLRAFDFLPVEVWGPPGIQDRSSSTHFQAYICSIVQNGLSFLLSGGLDVADLLLVPHACDSLQGLGSILIDFVSVKQPVIPVYIPRGRREGDIEFFIDELDSIFRQLKAITGRAPSTEKMMECILKEEEGNRSLRNLYANRSSLDLNNQAFYQLIRCREYLPVEQFNDLAQQALANIYEANTTKTPLVVSGIIIEPRSIVNAIEELGGTIIADDLACCGRRLYPAGGSEEPFRRIAEGIMNGPPDSTRGDSVSQRSQHLIDLVRQNSAKGVIFYNIKFCEPELFYIPLLRQALSQEGIPSTMIEVEINDQDIERIITRLEAFMENIQ